MATNSSGRSLFPSFLYHSWVSRPNHQNLPGTLEVFFFFFDQNFNFRKHITQVCGSCRYHIRDLRRIRRHLTLDNAKFLACALVASRMDYCNSLYYGLAEKDIKMLQRVQDTLARLVTRADPLSHAPPILKSLHWLPIRFRIDFKVRLLTFKTLQLELPTYLHSLLSKAIPSRSLRSNKGLLLGVPKVKTVTGSRAFSYCAPVLWNVLPEKLRSLQSVPFFRKHLKNLTDKNITCLEMSIGIGYESNMTRIKEQVLYFFSLQERLLDLPTPKIHVSKIKSDFVELVIKPWCLLDDFLELDSTLEASLKKHLVANNFIVENEESTYSDSKMLA